MNPVHRLPAMSEGELNAARRAGATAQLQLRARYEEYRQRIIRFHFEARRQVLVQQDVISRPSHPPPVIPFKPIITCLQVPEFANAYAHEERARILNHLLCTFIWQLPINGPDPIFGTVTTQLYAQRYQTTPHSPQDIFMTAHGALVYIETLPYIWVIAEAHDFDMGPKYFRCWRNRQATFPLLTADGSVRNAVTWKDISLKLIFEPLYSRCHASPCELGWGQLELNRARMMMESERSE